MKGASMNRILIVLSLCLPLSAFAATPETAVLDVQNMTCSMCTVTIRKALEKTPGVIEAKVDYDKKTATVKYDAGKANPTYLVKATTDAGFPSKLRVGGGK
jgi:mercuric ion binding protein